MQYAHNKRWSYRAEVAAKVARLAELLDEWDDWEVDQHLPPAERRLTRPPIGGRESLTVLHRALLAELHDLDGAGVVVTHGAA